MEETTLVSLISLSRHGTRAPNAVVASLCPPMLENMMQYNVPSEQLTEKGMEQMEKLGRHVKEIYIKEKKFLSELLSTSHKTKDYLPDCFETYFRADAADRCAQSAISFGRGLYPPGTGPNGTSYQPISVVQELLSDEFTFCAPKNKCKSTLTQDLDQYGKTRALELIQQPQYRQVLTNITSICGVTLDQYKEDWVMGIKDLTDSFLFDLDQEISPIEGLTFEMRKTIRQLQFTMLMERYYSTPRLVTYWASGFPELLLNNIDQSLLASSEIRYYSYHGHRELMYALSMLLGWPLDFPNQPYALNRTAIPPATTYFFEIHSSKTQSPWIETFI